MKIGSLVGHGWLAILSLGLAYFAVAHRPFTQIEWGPFERLALAAFLIFSVLESIGYSYLLIFGRAISDL